MGLCTYKLIFVIQLRINPLIALKIILNVEGPEWYWSLLKVSRAFICKDAIVEVLKYLQYLSMPIDSGSDIVRFFISIQE